MHVYLVRLAYIDWIPSATTMYNAMETWHSFLLPKMSGLTPKYPGRVRRGLSHIFHHRVRWTSRPNLISPYLERFLEKEGRIASRMLASQDAWLLISMWINPLNCITSMFFTTYLDNTGITLASHLNPSCASTNTYCLLHYARPSFVSPGKLSLSLKGISSFPYNKWLSLLLQYLLLD